MQNRTIKKVLFVTTDYSSFTSPISDAFKQLGYSIRLFDYQKPLLRTRALTLLGNYGILDSHWTRNQRHKHLQELLLNTVAKWKPDMVFAIKADSISPETINAINARGIITLNWYPEWLVLKKWILENAPAYSFFISGCADIIQELRKRHIPAYYMPYAAAADPQWKRRKKIYPISFVGQYSPRRSLFFSQISDLGLRIWGYSLWKKSNLPNIHSSVSVKKTLEIIRQSKIVVNLLTGNNNFQPNEINIRTYETTGVGTFLLVHDHPLLHKAFKVGKELVTFKTPNQLRQLCSYYLEHASEREEIAYAGWIKTSQKHTYIRRIRNILAIVEHEKIT